MEEDLVGYWVVVVLVEGKVVDLVVANLVVLVAETLEVVE